MKDALAAEALDQLFRSARACYGWAAAPLHEDVVRGLYDLLKWEPTSANSCPARFVWVRSPDSKAKLAELAWELKPPKILQAPLTVIVGNDLAFADQLPQLTPQNAEAMQKTFAPPAMAEATAMRNCTLQGAYWIIAARALGLDCGPMSGFDNASVDQGLFAGTRIRSSFISSLGYGDPKSLFPRNPRLSFEEAGQFA